MTLENLAQEYWEIGLEAMPLVATAYGIPGYDDQMGDPSKAAEDARAERLEVLLASARVLTPTETQDKITQSMLIDAVDRGLRSLKYNPAGLAVSPLIGPHSSLMQIAAQTGASSAEQGADLLKRYQQVGDWLEAHAARHIASVAAGRTHSAINVQHVIDQIERYLSSPIESDPFASTAVRGEWEGAEEWQAAMKDVAETVVRPAMAAYAESLRSQVLPYARSDEEPGLLHIPMGDEQYELLLEGFTTTDLTADEIHNVGLEMMVKLRAEFGEIGVTAFDISEPEEVIERLRSDPALKYSSEEEMVAAAEETIARAEAAVSDWFNVYPEAKCVVQKVEPELAPSMPPAYYMPPSQDGTRGGTYFLNTHEPTTRGAFDAESIAFHEAVPGHHFDRSVSGELTGLPLFRKFGNVTAFTEGWGLYSERLADEMGLYSSDISRLGMVSSDAWRAGRLVVDTGIHAKGWTRQQAIDYLVENTPIAEGVIATEVDRYISFPGQATSYMIGRLEIDKQRSRAKAALGDSFDIKTFHDIALTNGAVPLNVFAELIGDWIDA